jgi:hypothetical protein
MNAAMKPRVFWCLGMYASASTWLFNVARQIHEVAGQGPVKTHFFSTAGNFAGFDQAGVTNIVKSHEIKDERTILELSRRAERILVTMRDPRDAVTSLMLYHSYTFERALPLVEEAARLCMGFARDKRAVLWHYESGFSAEPATVGRIAAHLGYQLEPAAAQKIFDANRREEVEKYIAKMDRMPGVLQDRVSGDRLDPRTHWHTHHAGRDGEIGRWRHMLTAAQASEVADRLRDCYAFSD